VPVSWKAKDHDGHDKRVVGAKQALEDDEQADGDEIGTGDIQDALSDPSRTGRAVAA
jgi:hypothetical protein